jgi:hypothetical protein
MKSGYRPDSHTTQCVSHTNTVYVCGLAYTHAHMIQMHVCVWVSIHKRTRNTNTHTHTLTRVINMKLGYSPDSHTQAYTNAHMIRTQNEVKV